MQTGLDQYYNKFTACDEMVKNKNIWLWVFYENHAVHSFLTENISTELDVIVASIKCFFSHFPVSGIV